MRRLRPGEHPHWCAQGHVCSADRGLEHRSHPITAGHGQAVIAATRIQTVTGADRLEVRAVLTLPTNPTAARRAACVALMRLHDAIRATNQTKEN
jgi:hypothetical protein